MTSPTALSRLANETDLPFIRDLFNDVIANTTAIYQETPMSWQEIKDWWEHKRAGSWPVWIAEIDGEAVGFSAYGPFRARECYRPTVELAVHVAERWRGQGVGKKLLRATINGAREQGFHSMMAAIDSANAGSIKLHHSFGFNKVGEIKQVARKFGDWLDLTLMQLTLSEIGKPAEPADNVALVRNFGHDRGASLDVREGANPERAGLNGILSSTYGAPRKA